MKRTVVLPTGREKDILMDVTSLNSDPKGIVIFCHGYKGYKDWGAWNLVANEFARNGYTFIKFNFSHNGGTIENPIDFPDLKAFGNNTYSKEVADLHSVIDWSNKEFAAPIYIIGHSRGGGIVTLVGAENAHVSKVISWAAVADFKERFPIGEKLQQWKYKGVYHVVNGRTKQKMPHNYQFYEDFKQNDNRLNIERAVSGLTIPYLIIHGDNDTSISVNEAKELHQWNPKSELEIIQGADHVFNVKHPWNESELSSELEKVVRGVVDFLNK